MLKKYYLGRFFGCPYCTNSIKTHLGSPLLFYYKTVKKSLPNLTSPYVHGLFTVVLMKQIFEKNKSLRAEVGGRSGSRNQFKPEITPGSIVWNLSNNTA